MRRGRALFLLGVLNGLISVLQAVRHDDPISHLDDALRVLRHLRIVGDDDDRVPIGMQFLQDAHHLFAADAVGAPVGSSARMTSPPFIKARAMLTRCCCPPKKLPRSVQHALAQSQSAQQGGCTHGAPACHGRHKWPDLDVATGGQVPSKW